MFIQQMFPSFNKKQKPVKTKVCNPFKVGTKFIYKSSNTPCQIDSISVNEYGEVSNIIFTSLIRNENGFAEVSGGMRFQDFINECAW